MDAKPPKLNFRAAPKHLLRAESAVTEREDLFFGKDFELLVMKQNADRPLLDRLTEDDIGLFCDGFLSNSDGA